MEHSNEETLVSLLGLSDGEFDGEEFTSGGLGLENTLLSNDLGDTSLEVVTEVLVVAGSVRSTHELVDILTESLREIVAEHSGGGVVEGLHRSTVVDDDGGRLQLVHHLSLLLDECLGLGAGELCALCDHSDEVLL